jgi:hypothetical protein
MKIINLLPKIKQQALRNEITFRNVLIVFWISLFSFALVFAVQFALKVYLEQKSRVVSSEITRLKLLVSKEENAKVKEQIRVINNYISDYKTLADSVPKWSQVIEAFVVLPPEGVSINSFQVDLNRKIVNIGGFSPTRELVIDLYNNIKADEKHFSNVDYPLENVVRAKDIAFHFTFNIKDDLLK